MTQGRSRLGSILRHLLIVGFLLFQLVWPSSSHAAVSGCSDPPGYISLDGETVLEIRRAPAAQSLGEVIQRGNVELLRLAQDHTIRPAQITVWEDPPYTIVGISKQSSRIRSLMGVDDRAAACFELSRQELAQRYREALITALRRYRVNHSLSAWLKGTALALLMLGLYLLWIRLQSQANRWLTGRIAEGLPVIVKQLSRYGLAQVVGADRLRNSLQMARQLLHWSLLVLMSYLMVPLLLAFFPPTMAIARGLQEQIRDLVVGVLNGVVRAIPDLISIVVILVITVVLVRLSNAWFRAVEHGRIQIPGFYEEWALPTARIASIVLTLAGLAAAFPYIPGSGTKVFQGAGLLLGVLAALGSSAIATNIISGLMLIYTRAFREGDRVDINGVVGLVQERALLVTRVRTPRNELVSIPNATVINASVVNFSFSRREIRQPIALSTTLTIGYDVPWRKVHSLMLNAAQTVPGITDELEPFVLQTALNDFHISYELTAFVADASTYRETLSSLHAALQDAFAAAHVEILSPGYQSMRNGNRITIPPPWQGP